MTSTRVRPIHPGDVDDVAELRWRWAVDENGDEPGMDHDEFAQWFSDWTREHATTHRCLVLVRDDRVMGMAFLATVERVPTPRDFVRASGDLQCMYVLPEARNAGLGALLIGGVLDLAADLGLERVTVHSSVRAVSAYQRSGFDRSLRLLEAKPSRLGG